MCNILDVILSPLSSHISNIMADKIKSKTKEIDPRILAISKKIKQLRIDAGYSNYENFAWDNDMGRMQYWRMEKGVNFTISSLLKIVDAHKISLTDFFSEFEEMEK